MRTACVGCSKTFASPDKADEHHRQKHKPVKRSTGGTISGRFVKKWPDDTPGVYRNGESWGEFAGRREVTDLTPQITLSQEPKTGVDSPVSAQAIPGHVGSDCRHTPCLCGCHYEQLDCDTKGCS